MNRPHDQALGDEHSALAPEAGALLLARLFAIADDAVVIVDADGRIVLFNEGAERMFGHASRDMLGAPIDRLLPPAAQAAHRQHLAAFGRGPMAARRMGERGTIFGRRADGELFAAEASIAHAELGGRRFFAAILRDVEMRRRDEDRLAASEARFRALAEGAPVGVFEADADGALSYVNDSFCRLAGLPAEAALGHGWLQALHPDDRGRVALLWRSAVRQKMAVGGEWRFARDDQSAAVVAVEANAAPRRDAVGRVQGWIGTLTDVTERRRHAAELERARAEAESAARAKSLFLANISHEIRTPLNAVIGMTSLLLDTPMSDEQRDFAQTIRGSGEALLAVINDILDYSKADVGRIELEREVFDLRACIESSLDLVTSRAAEKRLNLAYTMEEGVPDTLLGDGARLRQILVNLLSNAVKFTAHGEVLLTASPAPPRDGQERPMLRLSVRDSGIGIAAEHLPRLFQPFSQVDASMTRRFGGTGLGLAISRKLAELMGGGIRVDSEPGRGSTFHLEIAAEAGPSLDLPHLQPRPAVLAERRVLVVDDNQTNRRILVRQLSAWGMQPTALPSAAEALDAVAGGQHFDLAIVDMSMPEVDGLMLAARLRRMRDAMRLPIVLLSSADVALGEAGERIGFAAHLRKPVKPAQLFAAMAAALRGRPVERGSASAAAEGGPIASPPLAQQLPLRILVAEDNPMNQKVALALLRRLGYRADLAVDGCEAVSAAAREAYDLVLLDVQMPEMDGVEAARRIARARGAARRPLLVAMTANAMPGDRETYLAAGMDGYIAKPMDLDEVRRMLLQLMQPAEAAAEGRTDARTAEPLIAGPDAEPLLDAARLSQLRQMQDDAQPDLVDELIGMFVADAPDHIDRIAQAIETGDAEQLRMGAHRFLSITDNLGARRMSALCRHLEKLARQGRLDEAPAALQALQTSFGLTRAELLFARRHLA